MTSNKILILLCLLWILGIPGCARRSLLQVSPAEAPLFRDDLSYAGLEQAIARSLEVLSKRPPTTPLGIAGTDYTVAQLIQSLRSFRALVARKPSIKELNRQLKASFNLYRASGMKGARSRGTMLVTGYYQPVFSGRLRPTPSYHYPLYSIPRDLAIRRDPVSGKKQIGRLQGSLFLPYWSRAEIENGNKASGAELVYLKDPLDAFILHVQGSGLIRLADGTLRGVHYALKNGRPYSSIGRYMVESGRIPRATASMKTIRNYLEQHPEESTAILQRNKSFIFFHWTNGHQARGNLGVPLTPKRSIAADQSVFPAGALAFLHSRKPVIIRGQLRRWQPFTRFVLIQDSGSAIRGPGRVDLYWGTGDRAGQFAGAMKEKGALYILLLKRSLLAKMAANE